MRPSPTVLALGRSGREVGVTRQVAERGPAIADGAEAALHHPDADERDEDGLAAPAIEIQYDQEEDEVPIRRPWRIVLAETALGTDSRDPAIYFDLKTVTAMSGVPARSPRASVTTAGRLVVAGVLYVLSLFFMAITVAIRLVVYAFFLAIAVEVSFAVAGMETPSSSGPGTGSVGSPSSPGACTGSGD